MTTKSQFAVSLFDSLTHSKYYSLICWLYVSQRINIIINNIRIIISLCKIFLGREYFTFNPNLCNTQFTYYRTKIGHPAKVTNHPFVGNIWWVLTFYWKLASQMFSVLKLLKMLIWLNFILFKWESLLPIHRQRT